MEINFSAIITLIAIISSFLLYFLNKNKQKKLELELLIFKQNAARDKLKKDLNKIETEIIDKRKKYEKAKDNLYNIINNRSKPPSDK